MFQQSGNNIFGSASPPNGGRGHYNNNNSQPTTSANVFASGSNQNAGNTITDRSTTRINHAPGGRSDMGSLLSWGGDEPSQHSRGQQVTPKPGAHSGSRDARYGAPSPFADDFSKPSGGRSNQAPQDAPDSYEPRSYEGKGGPAPPFLDEPSQFSGSYRDATPYGAGDAMSYGGRAPASARSDFYRQSPQLDAGFDEASQYGGKGSQATGSHRQAVPMEQDCYGASPYGGKGSQSMHSPAEAARFGADPNERMQYPGEPPFAYSQASQFEQDTSEAPRGKGGRARPPPNTASCRETAPFGTDFQPATPSRYRGERQAAPFGTDSCVRSPMPTGSGTPQREIQSNPDVSRDCRAANEARAYGGEASSSNGYANGANQNCGNKITDRRMTRINAPPGGHSSIAFG